MSKSPRVDLDTIVSLCKRRGFIFPGSEIYGGLANSWDYGPLGVELKNNLRDWWWQRFVRARNDMVGLDAAILMNPKVWEASGHLANFHDVQVDCRKCKSRFRADHLLEEAVKGLKVEGLSPEDLTRLIQENEVTCPTCAKRDWTSARRFNLMFATSLGTVAGEKSDVYLRSELAQSMFVDFKRVLESTRKRIPFGIAQIGKVFRNEITPGNFTYRTLEFDLMEFEYFVREEEWNQWFAYWQKNMMEWVTELGFHPDHVRIREHTTEELSHYSRKTVDIEYATPFGWKEMFGLAYRTDFDLKNHMQHSGQDLSYLDPDTQQPMIPHVIEPTFGLTRLVLMTLLEYYTEEEVPDASGTPTKRVVMKFPKRLAPYKVAVLPLSKKPELSEVARKTDAMVRPHYACEYDETQSIGRRYRRQDEIGTPYCVTIDFETLKDQAVTVRNRDTLKQDRIPIAALLDYLHEHLPC
ncbi:MAG: glycine--tRNA ligase [Candidatus Kerfeldbacteria bacterium]|nr:glycine--tRNA ligase [Candidatus Kerfeldbacteria bacterium]